MPREDLVASYETSAQITAIEDMIAQGADMQTVARLLCLASITTGGIKTRALESVKKEFLQVSKPLDIHFLLNIFYSGVWISSATTFAFLVRTSPLDPPAKPTSCLNITLGRSK